MSNSRVKANEVERWSGSLRDAAVWSRRFMGDADACGWSDILEGLQVYTPADPAHRDQAAINAITDDAARRAAQLIFTSWKRDDNKAYRFLLKALDDKTMLEVSQKVPGTAVSNAADAWAEVQKLFNDGSGITIALQLDELLAFEADDSEVALDRLHDQSVLFTQLSANVQLPTVLLNVFILNGLAPQYRARMKDKYLDEVSTLTPDQLRDKVKQHLKADAHDTVGGGRLKAANAMRRNDQRLDQLDPDGTLSPADVKSILAFLAPRPGTPCKHCNRAHPQKHADDCWKTFPEQVPKEVRAAWDRKDRERLAAKAKAAAAATAEHGGTLGAMVGSDKRTDQAPASLFAMNAQRQPSFRGAKGIWTPGDSDDHLTVDSGATDTAVSDCKLLTEVKKAPKGTKVKFADGSYGEVTHYGTLPIRARDTTGAEVIEMLPDVMVVPALAQGPGHLLSVKHLCKHDWKAVFQKGGDILVTPAGIHLPVHDHLELPVLPINTVFSYLCTACTFPIYHQRLAHCGQDKAAHAATVSTGVKIIGTKQRFHCSDCAMSKGHDAPHPRVVDRPTYPGQCVNSDVSGPHPPSLLNGNQYAIEFMDEYSEKRHIYFMKKKSEALARFKQFLLDFGHAVQVLKTDNGGEYKSHEFAAFERERGLPHAWTCPHTPQQNGKAERSWRTLKELTRANLLGAQLPGNCWERAMAYVCYVMNRIPTSDNPNSSPHEKLTGQRADHSRFRAFGCLAYGLRKTHRKAFDPTSEVGIFMGYEPQGWIIYIPARRHWMVTTAAAFAEEITTRAGRQEVFSRYLPDSTVKELCMQQWDPSEASSFAWDLNDCEQISDQTVAG